MAEETQSAESAYAGRWVALVRGKIIAQGETREQAFLSARYSRSKEKVEIRFMPDMPISSPILESIRTIVSSSEEIYLVGGAVRDAILGRSLHDFDFACHNGVKLAKIIADQLAAAYFPLDLEHDTARVITQNEDGSRYFLDFAGFRGETLTDDLRRRDFSINAVAMDLHSGAIIDPTGGVNDIRARRVRACSPQSFIEDPLRVLRAVRMAAGFGFTIDIETRSLMKEAASLLNTVSVERQRDELFKILEGPRPDAAIRALDMLSALAYVLPEMPLLKGVQQTAPHVHDVWNHTLAVLRHLENILDLLSPRYDEARANADLMNGLLVLRLGRYREQISTHLKELLNPDRSVRGLLFFAALYHDINKPHTQTVEEGGRIRFLGHDQMGAKTISARAEKLHLSNDELHRLELTIKYHMRIHGFVSSKLAGQEISRRARYRFFRDCGVAGVELVLLGLADTRATYEHTLTQEYWANVLDVARTLLEAWYEKNEEIVMPEPLINGNDLINIFQQKPGPELGKLLEAVRESQAEGHIHNRQEALAFVRGWMEKSGTHSAS